MNQTQIIVVGAVALGALWFYMRQREQEQAALALAAQQARERAGAGQGQLGIGSQIGGAVGNIAVGIGGLVDSLMRFDSNNGRSGSATA